jgi:hypothetical protein
MAAMFTPQAARKLRSTFRDAYEDGALAMTFSSLRACMVTTGLGGAPEFFEAFLRLHSAVRWRCRCVFVFLTFFFYFCFIIIKTVSF